MTTMTWARRMMVIGSAMALSAGLSTAAFGSPSAKTVKAHTANTSSISISDEYGIAWNCQFNPYSGADEFGSFGPIYEELVFMDSLKNGATTPWLASAWAWSNSDKTLTFTIRSGVKWSDGVPFDADDVVFSTNVVNNAANRAENRGQRCRIQERKER